MEDLKPNGIYSSAETRKFLKISESTIKRLFKKGLIRANKVGGQYRILGKEILRLVSPDMEKKAVASYQKFKKRAVKKLNSW